VFFIEKLAYQMDINLSGMKDKDVRFNHNLLIHKSSEGNNKVSHQISFIHGGLFYVFIIVT
jgi:hypothetical protein